jgi:hypothetical protein
MTVEIMPGFTLTDIETRGARIRLRHGGSGPPLLLLHGNPLTHVSWHAAMTKIFLAAAALWCLTGGGVLAEDAMTGTVKPFESVPFAPERDVACLASALEKPPSRRSLIGEAAVDVCGRRIGERLADALDEIVPYRREHAAQTRGDAGTEPDPRAAHQVRATAATGQQRSCSGEAVTSSVSSHSKPYKSCISDGLEQRTSIAR